MSNHPIVNILIVDDNEKARARLIDQLRYPDIRIVGESWFGAAAVSWASRLAVDVVIVAVEEPVVRGLRTIDLLTTGATQWPIVAVSTRGDRDSMRKAMLAGARDYLVLPASEEDVRRSVMLVHQREQEQRINPDGTVRSNADGTIIAVFGVKGGIGKTVAAVNIAASIALGQNNRVVLVDADTQFGDCAVMLDVVPERTIIDAASEVNPAMPHLIEPYLTDHASHLSLLAAPSSPGEADQVTPELISNALKSLAATSDFVVVDTSPQIDALTASIIDLASIVLVMVTPEVPCVRRTRAALDLLEAAGYSRDKIKLVLNRASKRAEVPNEDLEAALGYPIYAEIPDDRAVIRSITAGSPVIISDSKSDAARAFLALGKTLAGDAGAPRGSGVFGWLGRRGGDADEGAVPPPPNPADADALLAVWGPAMGLPEAGMPSSGPLDEMERTWAERPEAETRPRTPAAAIAGTNPMKPGELPGAPPNGAQDG